MPGQRARPVRRAGTGRPTSERAHGVPSPTRQYTVDFLWRERKTVAETDGLMKYDSGEVAIRELQRDRLIRDAGYQVVHITWKELLERPEHVIDRILTAFKAASPY